MKRRHFINTGLMAAGGTALCSSMFARTGGAGGLPSQPVALQGQFRLKYSPDFGLFENIAGKDPVDQIKFGAEQGFRAWESTRLLSWSVREQERISLALRDHAMEFGQFVAHMNFTDVTFARKDENTWEQVLKEIRAAVEVANRMNTQYVHVVLGRSDPNMAWGYQMASAIELLKRCREVLEPLGLIMVIEPMNHRINHPGMFLHLVSQAYELCAAVNSPACKILFDIYHVQIQEGNLIPNVDLAWDQIGYFQVGDTPGRKEPMTGEINYTNVFRHIYEKGYNGFLGLEHGTSKPGQEGEWAVIEAYRACDPK